MMQETTINHNEKAISELYPSITLDQWRFIGARLGESTDKAAAQKIDISPITVSKWPNKSEIDGLLKTWAASTAEGSRVVLEKMAIQASLVLLKLLESDDERIRIDAAKTILDRVNGKPTQQVEHSGDATWTVIIDK